jgi:hypothetical protein
MSRIDFVTGAPEQYAHLVDALATLPDRLRTATGGRRDAELRRGPESGGWSTHDILSHLAFYAHTNGVFIHQAVTMTDAQRRPFPPGHQDPELQAMDPAALLDYIDAEIGKTVDFLAGTPDAAWGRRGLIRGASQSVRQIVASHIAHFEEHVEEIARLNASAPAAAR